MDILERSIGASIQGRDIAAYFHGAGPDVVLVIGATHGDERATSCLVHMLREHMSRQPNAFSQQTVVAVPTANPDGWAALTRVNGGGVDINRNFPVDWSATFDEPDKNPGPAPASEPETRALMQLLEEVRPERVLTIHQPLDCNDFDGPRGLELAGIMAAHNGLPIIKLPGPYHGSFGSYCADRGVSVVTLELAKRISCEAAWAQQRDAMLAFIGSAPTVPRLQGARLVEVEDVPTDPDSDGPLPDTTALGR